MLENTCSNESSIGELLSHAKKANLHGAACGEWGGTGRCSMGLT